MFLKNNIVTFWTVLIVLLFIPCGAVLANEVITAEELYRAAQLKSSPDVMKLAIFPKSAKIYDSPFGEKIGELKRGRVIYLLDSEGEWIHFSTREFPSAWILWGNTVTLDEWASKPPYDSTAAYITLWEMGVRRIEVEVDTSLNNILKLRNAIAGGEIILSDGIYQIQVERRTIEECFRYLYKLRAPEPLEEAVDILAQKRWALDKGLGYLVTYLETGDKMSGRAAGKYFELAESIMHQYSKQMFQVKSFYNLYDEEK